VLTHNPEGDTSVLQLDALIKWTGRVCAAGIGAAYGAIALTKSHALRAAGVNGQPPSGAGAIKEFVDTITDNALWIIGTTAGLSILMIGALFFFGHTRAQDYAARIAVGAVIVVAAPGIAS
jgi:hypothetical protein